MSARSWERKVRKNQAQLNKQRKKRGEKPLNTGVSAPGADIFKGRSIILPAFLVLFTALFAIMSTASGAEQTSGTLFWVTIVCYLLLAVMFILRRPYLAVGKDYVKTRRFSGDRMLMASNIKAIKVEPGNVVIEQVKGANWVFTRTINRYPIEQMTERLRAFAAANQVTFNEK
ncbi:hypothetical protein [Paenibacillus sp. GCM10027626]|uniref:hypothetical protein n=1 Tax=Paenibacillus sp. GCM10027626 TaxID=3273411 RepID=UPI00363B7408